MLYGNNFLPGMSLELYRIRQKRFTELVDKGEWELLTTEFHRSISAWEKRLANSGYDLEVIEEALENCRKCPDFWLLLLERSDDPEMFADALEAVGLDWDGDKVVAKVEEFLKSHQLMENHVGFWSRIVNRSTLIDVNTSEEMRNLFEIKARYEPIVFPKNSSSFSIPEKAMEYFQALDRADEKESLLQRLVFWYNDDVSSWRMYCMWLFEQGRKDDVMMVLERVRTCYVSYNPNMWAMCGMFAMEAGENEVGEECFREALKRSPEFLECSWLEKIAEVVPEEDWNALYPNDSLQGLFVMYLMWSRSGEDRHLKNLVETLKSRNNVDPSEADLSLLCYALEKAKIDQDIRLDRILKQNGHKILRMLPEDDEVRQRVVELIEGTTSAPLPVCKAPPKPVVHVNSHNLPKRPLPGYTPGWMAEEFAKKHRI